MIKRILVIIGALYLVGCTAARESEFGSHGTLYQNLDHYKFSWWGYKTPTAETYKKTIEQGWWGKPIPYSGTK